MPLMALRFCSRAATRRTRAGKEGLANFMSGMLDEGAGDLSSAPFQERMEELACRMSFDDTRDAFYGNFETLTANRDAAVELLRLAITKPRFDADAVERVRKQLLASLAYAAKTPTRSRPRHGAPPPSPAIPTAGPSEGTSRA